MMQEPARELPRKRSGSHQPTQLFLLRVWIEKKNASQGTQDVAGKVQDPVSGQVHFFSGGFELVRVLIHMILKKEAGGPSPTIRDDQS